MTTPVFDSFAAFCEANGVNPSVLKDALRAAFESVGEESPIHLLETGQMHADQWNGHLAAAISVGAPSPIDPAGLKERLFAEIRPEASMVNAVMKVRSGGIRTGLLSNSWGEGGYPTETFPMMFDAVVISGEVGMRKPEPEIYRLVASKLGLDASECVFVDDFASNVAGAEAVGMKGIHHTDPSATIEKIKELFGLDID